MYLTPEPLGLLSQQFGLVRLLPVEQSVEGRLVVSSLPGHPGTLQPALPHHLLTHGPAYTNTDPGFICGLNVRTGRR